MATVCVTGRHIRRRSENRSDIPVVVDFGPNGAARANRSGPALEELSANTTAK